MPSSSSTAPRLSRVCHEHPLGAAFRAATPARRFYVCVDRSRSRSTVGHPRVGRGRPAAVARVPLSFITGRASVAVPTRDLTVYSATIDPRQTNAARHVHMTGAPQIYVYGWSSDEREPPFIRACLSSIEKHSGCELVIVTPATISSYLPQLPAEFHYLKPPHQSDVFRLHVLFRHGGMYLDADTVVLRDLTPLFDLLGEYELIGADWRPPQVADSEHESLGTAVLGPMRPGLEFLRCAIEEQSALLAKRSSQLKAHRHGTGKYPFAWEEVGAPIINRCFERKRPKAFIKDGASTWFSLGGGLDWHVTTAQHPYRTDIRLDSLPESELFTLAKSLMPAEKLWKPVNELLKDDDLLAELLRCGLANGQNL